MNLQLETARAVAATTRDDLNRIVSHLVRYQENFVIADRVERLLFTALRKNGAIQYNTPIVSHGMREYRQRIASVVFDDFTAFLRHSPEFEKQLIALSTDTIYFQKAPCCRPSDSGKFHVPYLHQVDLELPFSTGHESFESASLNAQTIILDAIRSVFSYAGIKVESIVRLSYDDAMARYGTESPYIDGANDSVQIAVVANPPLFVRHRDGRFDTEILPMAQPIWSDAQESSFIAGELMPGDLRDVRVCGYDFVVSAPFLFDNDERPVGLEVAGGSVRIRNPAVQRRILELVRPAYLASFEPLIALLCKFEETGRFSAGGAIGLERMSMLASRSLHITEIQPIPWFNGQPSFLTDHRNRQP